MPDSDVIKTVQVNVSVLARWANELNSWQWPDDMPDKPDGFDDMPNGRYNSLPAGSSTKYDIITPLIHLLTSIVGDKEVFRQLRTKKLWYSNSEFEEWWYRRETMTPDDFYQWSTSGIEDKNAE